MEGVEAADADKSYEFMIINNETEVPGVSMDARQACQFGDSKRLIQFLDTGLVTPNYVDADDCSLLHWAAINNRLEIAKILIERRCNVNAVGGILASTPLHWAARHGHAKMVALLVRSGADWTIRDVEGFTALHIAIQFGCTHVAAYLIASGQSPDEQDATRMTPAVWAAYKVYNSDPLHMLFRMGADLEKADMTYRNSPLHWAVVQSNHAAIEALIKLKVDLVTQNKEKEAPLDIACRKNDHLSKRLLEMGLRERKIYPSTLRQNFKENKEIAQRVLFILPYLIIFLTTAVFDCQLNILSKIALLSFMTASFVFIFRFFSRNRLDEGIRTFLFGLSTASKIFIILIWLLFVHPLVPWHMQIEFLVALVAIPLLFYLTCTSNPGYIIVTHKERCKMIATMTEETNWKGNFCSTCLITRPIRSKHCSVCDKCVILFDHHCPWINNCVGGNNHRLFITYLLTMNVTVLFIFIGCFFYWQSICGQITPVSIISCNKPWVLVLHSIAMFYTFFLTSLNCIQGYQILTAFTTNERLNMYRYRHFQSNGSFRSPFTRGCAGNFYSFWCQTAEDSKPLR